MKLMPAPTYHGKPHKVCGTTEKYLSTGQCRVCAIAGDIGKRERRKLNKRREQTVRLQESY